MLIITISLSAIGCLIFFTVDYKMLLVSTSMIDYAIFLKYPLK
jgi:hypothetical protein